jgi:hypothetical protein
MPFNIVFQDQLPGARGSYRCNETAVDAAGNHYFIYGDENTDNSNITPINVKKYAPNGVLLGHWVENLPHPHKVDFLSASHSGQELVIDALTHTYEGVRIKAMCSIRINVGFVTTPQFEAEVGGPDAFVGNGGEPQGEPGMTKQEFIDALKNPSDELTVQLGKLMKNNARIAIDFELNEEGVLDMDNVHSSYGLWRRFVESTYEQVGKVLDERGFPKPEGEARGDNK